MLYRGIHYSNRRDKTAKASIPPPSTLLMSLLAMLLLTRVHCNRHSPPSQPVRSHSRRRIMQRERTRPPLKETEDKQKQAARIHAQRNHTPRPHEPPILHHAIRRPQPRSNHTNSTHTQNNSHSSSKQTPQCAIRTSRSSRRGSQQPRTSIN